MAEKTFVMVKPDGVSRRLIGEIIGRYERKGLKLVAMRLSVVTREMAEQHYAEHKDKPFFGDLVDFITSAPTVQMVWEGDQAVEQVRKINGATSCFKADLGTIRGDLGLSMQNNLVHASDSVETAEREVGLYFGNDNVISYALPDESWLGA